MEKQSGPTAVPAEPVVVPDVATAPHPTTPAAGQAPADVPKAGEGVLEEAPPPSTRRPARSAASRSCPRSPGRWARAKPSSRLPSVAP